MKKKNNNNKEYNKFKDMALFLLAHKLFSDYIDVGIPNNSEPEHFYEIWMRQSVENPDSEMLLWTWRYFITKLISYRKINKK